MSAARRWWTHSNLGVALVAAAVTAGTFPLLGLSREPALLVLAASGAFLVYQIDRGLVPSPEDAINRPARTRWVRRHAPYVHLSTSAAVLAAGWALIGQPPAVWMLTGLLGTAGIGYALRDRIARISPFGRRLEILKPAVIAGVWALGAVLLPAVANPAAGLEGGVILLVLYRWGAIAPNLLLADWPDRAGDRSVGRSTPAVRWSEGRLVRICRIVLVFTLAGGIAAVLGGYAPPLLLVDCGGPLATLLAIRRPLPDHRPYYDVLLDGLIGWPAVTVLVGTLG